MSAHNLGRDYRDRSMVGLGQARYAWRGYVRVSARDGMSMPQRFTLYLIKPSHYDDHGYPPIRWR